METKEFPNGFDSWYETHHEVVSFLTLEYARVAEIYEMEGTERMYELARELTDEFETLNKGREWDGEFFEEIESFLKQKINNGV